MSRKSGIFMDRDGTLIEEANYLADPAGVKLIPNIAPGLRRLQEQGRTLLVVTNQSGIARGLYTLDAMVRVNERLENLLRQAGVTLDRIYFCPHHPQGNVPEFTTDCGCRKPAPGMLERGLREFGLSAQASWMIGDKLADIESGHKVGMRTILVLTGYGAKTRAALMPGDVQPDFIMDDFATAAQCIAEQD